MVSLICLVVLWNFGSGHFCPPHNFLSMFQKNKSQWANICQAPACITFTNIQPTKASHMAKPRVIVTGGACIDINTQGCDSSGAIIITVYQKMYYNYLVNCNKSYKQKNCHIKRSQIVKVIIKIEKNYRSKFGLTLCLPP